MFYRIYQVCQKPNSELVEILGIDIPPVPEVALAGITTDSVLLYWKPPENYHSPLKHFVQVNGINVGEFNRSDASVQVTGLKPGTYYGIRAIATNAANLSSQSRLIQVQTVPLTGHEGSRQLSSLEQSGTQNYGKRNGPARRHSSITNSSETANGQIQANGTGGEDQGPEETMAQLTKKLDSLRRQQEEVERQIAEDTAENERIKTALTKERDELRQKVDEKEKAHLEFKKQVNELEKQCKAAQRRKSAKERQLQQKKVERQKKLDEIAKWKVECIEMRTETEDTKKEKVGLEDARQKRLAASRKIIDEANADNKVLEEEIRVWGIKIKELEEERRRTDSEQNEEELEAERREREDEEIHDKRVRDYQVQVAELWNRNQQAEIDCQQADERLSYWLTKRAKEPHSFIPILGLDFPASSTTHSSRRIRQGVSRASTVSQSSTGYPKSNSAFNGIAGMSPTFVSASPYFSMGNGMTVPTNDENLAMSQREVDILTAGAPMSPTANNLLPSNLLRDDDISGSLFDAIANQGDESGINPHSYMASGTEGNNQDPQSPMSIDSRSPSLVSSPQESIHNQHGYNPSRDPLIDSDRRSTHSAGSPFAPPGINIGTNASNGRRLVDIFGFSRQRGKSAASEAPSLGTLKQGQSQSFPRNYDQEPPDPMGSGRRRIGSGTWTNPMTTFLARNVGSNSGADGDSAPNTRFSFPRKNRLPIFGSKLDPSDQFRSSSPRPASTYSFENALPRPSSDSQPFGWASPDNAHQRSSPLVADWSSVGPWSRNQSRRASVQYGSSSNQYGSTSNLSIGSTPLDPDDFSSPYGIKISPPAPIGTGRGKAGRTGAPKLNPAAPSFTTRLFSRNDAKKSSKGDKNAEKSGDNAKGKEVEKPRDCDSDYTPDESSPPNSRLSKDAYSIATATSVGESHDSLEHSNSATPSEGAAASAPKESLMQRITRKSSSSKFNVPWSGGRSGSLFSKKTGEPSTPGEVDEDRSSDFLLGKGAESPASTPQHEKAGRASLTWSRVMSRKSKKGEKEASESSEKASETETGDDDEP
ncbi:hypothetical protein MMC30_004172 [Trapelia coarctata]|nr:hypothetical protein [Trapelia coarctata]